MKSAFIIAILGLITFSLGQTGNSQTTLKTELPIRRAPATLLSPEQTALLFGPGGLQEILMRRFVSTDSLRAECYVSFRAVQIDAINWNQGKRMVAQDIIRQLLESGRMGVFAGQFNQYLVRQDSTTVSDEVRFVATGLAHSFK